MQTEMPGMPEDEGAMHGLGWLPLRLDFECKEVDLGPVGFGRKWRTADPAPAGPGLYVFTVESPGRLHVCYAGMTEHLWMVTKGRLPCGAARGGNRYGDPSTLATDGSGSML